MTSPASQDEATIARIDAAIEFSGLVLRGLVYAAVAGLAHRYPFGTAVLAGVLVGDLAGSVARLLWHVRERLPQAIADLALLGLIYLWVRADLAWPDTPAMRGVLGLAALGAFTARIGTSALTRFGPGDDVYA